MNFKFILYSSFFLLVSFSCSSIKKSLNKGDRTFLNKTIDSMYVIDQNIRYATSEIDSIYKVDRKSNGKYLFEREKKEKLGNKYFEYKKLQDSVLSMRKKIDSLNTEKLLFITKKYGFPSKDRLRAKKASAYLIFVHSHRDYYLTIKNLINSEYKAKRISEYEKAYIFWHLNGRNQMPPRLAKDGSVIYGSKVKMNRSYKVQGKKVNKVK